MAYFLFSVSISVLSSQRGSYLSRIESTLTPLGWSRDSGFSFSKHISVSDAALLGDAEEEFIAAATASLTAPFIDLGDGGSAEVLVGRVTCVFNGSLRCVIQE